MPAQPSQPRRRRGAILAGLTAAVVVGAVPVLGFPRLQRLRAVAGEPVQLDAQEKSKSRDPMVSAMRTAFEEVEPMKAKVEQGHIISHYGKKAESVVKDAAALSKSVKEAQLSSALDGALYSLYMRQLAEVRKQVADQFSRDRRPETAAKRADAKFVSMAKDLVKPGSSWDYEAERAELKASLNTTLRHNKALSEERARVAETQRATADVIGKLQKNMEQLGEKLRGTGSGSPWIVWTSYHLPGTPIQVSGRYTQGRANIEFNMARNKDPVNAEAGFVEGLGETALGNLGLSLNVGV